MFLNISNHSSDKWSKQQMDGALQYGEIIDYGFPNVEPNLTSKEVSELANNIMKDILKMEPDVVMCQGEFTLTYLLVSKLKEKGIKVVAACTERDTEELQMLDGTLRKTSVFKFVQFREY